MLELLEIPFYDDDLIKLAFRLAHDVVFLALVVILAWHPNARDREFVFATVMLNITVFFICFTMKKLELSLGMAIGLFAIFGVLRYRTDTIRIKDMTYLFIVIGIAVVNALSNKKTSYAELLAVNVTIVVAAMVGEWLIGKMTAPKTNGATNGATNSAGTVRKQSVEYDKLELLASDRRDELIEDLRQRTHLDIERVRVNTMDLPNDRATLSVWYVDRADDAVES
ncbi:MAG: DUF4956 domain-containing protein [Planctomycetota bacterium]